MELFYVNPEKRPEGASPATNGLFTLNMLWMKNFDPTLFIPLCVLYVCSRLVVLVLVATMPSFKEEPFFLKQRQVSLHL